MKKKILEIKAALQILKPVHEVFEAIVDPEQMKHYFISYSSGEMKEGKQITWRFPEFDLSFPIRVGRIENDRYISYYWTINDQELLVEMTLSAINSETTIVTITEKSMDNNETGINWLKRNTEGWANFLACLKAWLEYGINLRKGAFDFMKSSLN